MVNPPHWPLALDEACFAGDGVAVVVADEPRGGPRRGRSGRRRVRGAARGRSTSTMPRPTACSRTPTSATNASYTWELVPDPAAVDAAFAGAAHVVRERYVQQRLIPMAMEPRGVCVDPRALRRRLHRSTRRRRSPTSSRSCSRSSPASREHKLRVVAPVGRRRLRLEAQRLRRGGAVPRPRPPARPAGALERGPHARTRSRPRTGAGMIQDIELAADADGRIARGARPPRRRHGRVPAARHAGRPAARRVPLHRRLRHPRVSFTCTGVFTNRTPTDAYRGAGRPEATYAIERAIDVLAREVGIDPAEIRRRNFIATDKFPYTSVGHARVRQRRLRAVRSTRRCGWPATTSCARSRRRRRAAGDTKHLGIGFSSYVEMCGLAPSRALGGLNFGSGGWEHAVIRGPADRQGRGRHRHRAARPGPRDVVGDDRRRPSRRPGRRRLGAALRHRDLAPRVSTPTARGRSPSAAARSTRPARR